LKRQTISRRDRRSTVWIEGGRVFKSQPKYLTDNEYFWLTAMENSGYVPINVVREDIELISMELVVTGGVTDPDAFMSHYRPVLEAMSGAGGVGVRHGDLTKYAVLVRDNKPVIIDWAEARIKMSPIESKRPEGDWYWLQKTMRQLAKLD
jgi:RIO-like serine/threonine protein kinase